MANTYLTYTPSAGDATARQKWTWSAWIKRSKLGSSQFLFCGGDGGSYPTQIYLGSADVFAVYDTGENATAATSAKLRDTNGWYHLVARFDATQGTAADKMKLYINGVQQSLGTSWNQSNTNPTSMGKTETHVLGRRSSGDNFDGLMSHVHFCVGYSYGPDSFGSTDSTTGEWKINTAPSVSYGSQGFWWLKDSIATTDHSPNSNTFTTNGTLTFTHDNPSNIFATINPTAGNPLGLSTGGLKAVQSNGGTSSYNPKYFSNLGYAEGKFYWETKVSTFSTGSGHSVGLFRTNKGHVPSFGGDSTDSGQSIGSNGIFYFFGENTTYFSKYGSNEQSGSLGSTLSSGDIISCSHDVSAGEFKYYVNGSQIGSTLTSVSSANDGYYYIPLWGFESKPSTRYCTMEMNMGNGYFGTTAISTNSGNGYADADSRGKFNYSVPTNHRALCTRGLNQ